MLSGLMVDSAAGNLAFIGMLIAVVAVIWIIVKAAIRTPSIRPSASTTVNDDNSERLWSRHNSSLEELELKYVEFETDPWSAFRRPLLADVREAETAAFHQAMRHAQDLRTDTVPTSRRQIDEYGNAVHAAHMAWQIADQHARDIAVPTTTDSERRRLRQAEDALRIALDERATVSERRLAIERVETLIKGLTRIEPAAKTHVMAALEHNDRKGITS